MSKRFYARTDEAILCLCSSLSPRRVILLAAAVVPSTKEAGNLLAATANGFSDTSRWSEFATLGVAHSF